LDKVTACVAAAAPIVCDPKATADGLALTAGAGADTVPDNATDTAPFEAFEASARLPLNAPLPDEFAVTVTVQLPPAGTDVAVLHVPPRLNTPAFVPPTVMLLKVSAAWPELLTVTLRAGEAMPLTRAPKSMAFADSATVACGTALPVPASATVLEPPVALCAMTSDALREPEADGVKPTCTVQLVPAASDVPLLQVPPPIE
jgi:hypothetical protein